MSCVSLFIFILLVGAAEHCHKKALSIDSTYECSVLHMQRALISCLVIVSLSNSLLFLSNRWKSSRKDNLMYNIKSRTAMKLWTKATRALYAVHSLYLKYWRFLFIWNWDLCFFWNMQCNIVDSFCEQMHIAKKNLNFFIFLFHWFFVSHSVNQYCIFHLETSRDESEWKQYKSLK